MSIKDTIKSLDFFKSLDDSTIELISSISSLKSYSKNYILGYEKKENSNLFFLVKGLAKAYKIDKHQNEIFLYYIYENSILSEISDINSETLYSFSNIELIEDSQILSINYQKFKNEILKKNILCFEFTNEVILRSQKLQELVNREFIFDSVSKVAMMIATDLNMFNKLKRHDISLILHIQPATLSRVLNRLKRNNIIDIDRGKVNIIDSKSLEDIYKE